LFRRAPAIDNAGMFKPLTRLPIPSFGSALGVPCATAIGYVLVYLLLDWVSFVHPMRGLNITPWNPQTALAVALLLWYPRGWWLVWLTLAGAETAVRGVSVSWPAEVLSSAMLTVGYVATAMAIRRWLGPLPQIASRKTFLVFVLIVCVGAMLNAVLFVGSLSVFGIPQPDRMVTAVMRGWIGDAVSLIVTLPVLFALGSRERRADTIAMVSTVECWLVAAAAVVAAYAVFGRSTEEQFKFFYLLFLPVVWGAARFGVIGAVWSAALVQVLLILAVQAVPYRPLTVFEFHMLMAALAATGLLLGTTVDEREEADRALRASLHLAAAGDMAAALAHELNQPLTALSTYARASQLLAQRLGSEHQAIAAPFTDVTTKLVNEASRAGDVVKRLRDFFRSRRTDLQPTEVRPLIEEIMQSQSVRASTMGIRTEWACDSSLPPVWLDRVQIEVVLRNLVSNALDAATDAANPEASVRVQARIRAEQLVVSVQDTGDGVPVTQLHGLFDSRPSTKPGGMGIGLGISRSIIEAHGGRLWAEPGPGGKFYFSLPLSVSQGNE